MSEQGYRTFLIITREANQKLQDTNDGLRTMVDVAALNSPRGHSRAGSAAGGDYGGGGGAGLLSPDIVLRSSSDLELAEKLYQQQNHPLQGVKRNRRRK